METPARITLVDAILDWIEHCIRTRPRIHHCWACRRTFWAIGETQGPSYCSDHCRNAEEIDPAWQCLCGHIQSDGFHCDVCGAQPPWGCDCRICGGTLPQSGIQSFQPDCPGPGSSVRAGRPPVRSLSPRDSDYRPARFPFTSASP